MLPCFEVVHSIVKVSLIEHNKKIMSIKNQQSARKLQVILCRLFGSPLRILHTTCLYNAADEIAIKQVSRKPPNSTAVVATTSQRIPFKARKKPECIRGLSAVRSRKRAGAEAEPTTITR